MKKLAVFALLSAFLVSFPTFANAAPYPTKQVSIIVPYNPGGTADLSARPLAQYLTQALKQPVVVINRPGAGGSVAAAEVARARADGYTFLVGSAANLTIVPYSSKLPYNLKSFEPVGMITDFPLVVAVPANAPYQTFQDFVAFAKANPDKIRYGTPGASSTQQLTMETVAQTSGVSWVHMPMGGAPACVAGVLGGHLEATCLTYPDIIGNYEAKTLKVLAIANKARHPKMPDVPTLKECGYDVSYSVHYSLMAPAKTPKSVIDTVAKAMQAALKDPEVVAMYDKIKAAPSPMAPAELKTRLEADDVNFKKTLDGIAKISTTTK